MLGLTTRQTLVEYTRGLAAERASYLGEHERSMGHQAAEGLDGSLERRAPTV